MADNNGNNLKMLIIIAVLVVIIAAGTSFTVMKIVIPGLKSSVSNNSGKTASAEDDEIGPTYNLGDYTVNLSNTGGYKFIKASIVAEISNDNVKKELEKRQPQIRDIIISILRSQKIEDIEEPKAVAIKNLIMDSINNIICDGKITNIWFTQLVVQ